MGNLIFVLGGVRSGKSTYAEARAEEIGGDRVLMVATAEAKDEEMAERIRQHRENRPAAWRTVEASQNPAGAIRSAVGDAKVVLVDCLSMLVSNILLSMASAEDDGSYFDSTIEQEMRDEVCAIVRCASEIDADMIVVSNEVGMGVVPPSAAGRAFRDLLGRANQLVAEAADEVILMVAGIQMRVK
ncbi:MAG: bifunctional adenosylcobinamide kinase/adenosylcobinamide-phosphate guanylyltransferase [Anaerolineae bacterium]|nr:bifunctional adenosylcobinamide kinase/adenosylcobinamide-phosphate guanylyltransferase [Anaerolineae bacterium]